MSTINDITGDGIHNRPTTEEYKKNFDAIDWGKYAKPKPDKDDKTVDTDKEQE